MLCRLLLRRQDVSGVVFPCAEGLVAEPASTLIFHSALLCSSRSDLSFVDVANKAKQQQKPVQQRTRVHRHRATGAFTQCRTRRMVSRLCICRRLRVVMRLRSSCRRRREWGCVSVCRTHTRALLPTCAVADFPSDLVPKLALGLRLCRCGKQGFATMRGGYTLSYSSFLRLLRGFALDYRVFGEKPVYMLSRYGGWSAKRPGCRVPLNALASTASCRWRCFRI